MFALDSLVRNAVQQSVNVLHPENDPAPLDSANHLEPYPFDVCINRSSRRKRSMMSNPLFIIPDFFLHFPNELCYGYLRFEGNGKRQTFFPTFLKEFSHFLQTQGSHSWVLLENAKKNLVFHFGVGRHASFPQKPVVKAIFFLTTDIKI